MTGSLVDKESVNRGAIIANFRRYVDLQHVVYFYIKYRLAVHYWPDRSTLDRTVAV